MSAFLTSPRALILQKRGSLVDCEPMDPARKQEVVPNTTSAQLSPSWPRGSFISSKQLKRQHSFLVSILSFWLQSTKPRGSYSVKPLPSLVTHLVSGLSTSSDWGVWFGHRNLEGQGHMHTEGDFYTVDEVSLMPNYIHFYFQSVHFNYIEKYKTISKQTCSSSF